MAEQGQDFAARYWGGEGITAEPRAAERGPRDIDGGRVRYPRGWVFRADGFRYRVWSGRSWGCLHDGPCFHMEASDGSFASFRLDGDDWVVDSLSGTRRVPARVSA